MSVLEPPIERVNYFNGERLEARDFRAEQEYFVRVRRLLNRSLYSPGIVKGLEVTKHATDKHKVIVSPGLAFDAAGREIVLLDSQTVQVVGSPSTKAGTVLGNFLTISYAEQRGMPSGDACHPATDACGCELAWRGPTRIRSNVALEVVAAWPSEASGRIVLAQIELAQGCEVVQVHAGVRKYAVAAKAPKVRGVSIEGEKDIDSSNSKRLFFQVEGSYPDRVILVLRATQFSTLFYTELGSHTHALDITIADAPAIAAHDHALGELLTDETGLHSHGATSNFDEDDPAENSIVIDGSGANDQDMTQLGFKILDSGKHTHKIAAGAKTSAAGAIAAHNHPFTTKAAQPFGVLPPPGRTGQPLKYVDDLKVKYDGQDITLAILQQLNGRDAVTWPLLGAKLGNGTNTHPLVTVGTGDINLTQIVDDIGPGPHELELKVAAGGGQIHYNLYVE